MTVKIFYPKEERDFTFKDFEKKICDIKHLRDKPFTKKRVDILGKLSKKFLKSSLGLSNPQIMVLGFWLRPASISSFMREHFSKLPKNSISSPRGVAFHLPPQNVDTMFVYSWAISFLMGNINIVRLPTELNDLSKWIIKEIVDILEANGEEDKNIFCNYSFSSECNNFLSQNCDVRVVWGGDKKINSLSQTLLKPTATNINFPDRQSLCLIKSEYLDTISKNELNTAAEKLYNDIFWFDQMGCGSPKAIVFLGNSKKQIELYRKIAEIAKEKDMVPEASTIINKFVNLNEMAGLGISIESFSIENILNISKTKNGINAFEYFHGGGSIFHFEISNLIELEKLLSDKTQTITYLGLNDQEKEKCSEIMSQRGGLRLVNIGDALAFDKIWDGYDLFAAMSKLIKVE